jgi:hypothetical protein
MLLYAVASCLYPAKSITDHWSAFLRRLALQAADVMAPAVHARFQLYSTVQYTQSHICLTLYGARHSRFRPGRCHLRHDRG